MFSLRCFCMPLSAEHTALDNWRPLCSPCVSCQNWCPDLFSRVVTILAFSSTCLNGSSTQTQSCRSEASIESSQITSGMLSKPTPGLKHINRTVFKKKIKKVLHITYLNHIFYFLGKSHWKLWKMLDIAVMPVIFQKHYKSRTKTTACSTYKLETSLYSLSSSDSVKK